MLEELRLDERAVIRRPLREIEVVHARFHHQREMLARSQHAALHEVQLGEIVRLPLEPLDCRLTGLRGVIHGGFNHAPDFGWLERARRACCLRARRCCRRDLVIEGRKACWALLLIAGAACTRSPDFEARDVCVELAASVTASPARIALSWPAVPLHDTQIVLQRKLATEPSSPARRRRSSRPARRAGWMRMSGRGSPTTTSSSVRFPTATGRALASCAPVSSCPWSKTADRLPW